MFGRLGSVQVRYLLPVLLPLALLGARALRRWRPPRWARVVIVAACVAQAAGAVGYTAWRRQIPPAEREAYAWLATHATGRIFTPEQVVTNRTGREFVWKQLRPAYFMAAASDGVRRELLAFFDVSHIVASSDDPVAWAQRRADRIERVHLRDAMPGNLNLGIGRGDADFPAVIAALEAGGFTGTYILELETHDVAEQDREADARRSRDEIVTVLEAVAR